LPEADFASSEFPAADFPSEEMPATRARTRPAPPKTDAGRDRSDSRRKPGKGQSAPKGRSRKRDDDDWPSMEWDKLTDEQYWAQLSSDKPLAATARSAPPAGEARPAASKNGQARPAAREPKPAPTAQPTAPHARSRDLPGRKAANPQREAAPEREAVSRRDEAASRRVTERETVSRRETAAQRESGNGGRSAPAPAGAPCPGTTHRSPPLGRYPTPPAGQPSLAMLTSLASVAGALTMTR
jgi:hypothetical protein